MRKVFQLLANLGLCAGLTFGVTALVHAKPVVSTRLVLSTPLDQTELPSAVRAELNRLLLDDDGFGTRVSDVVTLDPARISAASRQALETFLRGHNLRLGLSAAELRKRLKAPEATSAVDAYGHLSTRTKNGLKRLGIYSLDQLVEQHTYVSLLCEFYEGKIFEEIVRFARTAGAQFRGAERPDVLVPEVEARARLRNQPRAVLSSLGIDTAEHFARLHSVESLISRGLGPRDLKPLLEYAAAAGYPLAVTEQVRTSAGWMGECAHHLDAVLL